MQKINGKIEALRFLLLKKRFNLVLCIYFLEPPYGLKISLTDH